MSEYQKERSAWVGPRVSQSSLVDRQVEQWRAQKRPASAARPMSAFGGVSAPPRNIKSRFGDIEADASVRGLHDLGNLLSRMTVVGGAGGPRGNSRKKRPKTGIASYDKKKMLDNWIGEELSKFEVKQSDKALEIAREAETASGPTKVSANVDNAASNYGPMGRGGDASSFSNPVRASTASYARARPVTKTRQPRGVQSAHGGYKRTFQKGEGSVANSNTKQPQPSGIDTIQGSLSLQAADAYRDPAKTLNRPRLGGVSSSYQHGFKVAPATTDHRQHMLRSQNQLLPEEYRRLMMMKSPKEEPRPVVGHPNILSDTFSKMNVRQAVALQSGLDSRVAFVGTHEISNSALESLERGQTAAQPPVLNSRQGQGPSAATPAHQAVRRSIPTAPSSVLASSKMATMQLRKRPLSGVRR